MKTDIIIRTAAGFVRLNPTGPETFDLVGPETAVNDVIDLIPAWEPADNQTGSAGDALVHLLYLRANDTTEERAPKLVSHKEMQDRTLTENPIVLFQVRDTSITDEDGEAGWRTVNVMIDDDDVTKFVEQQRHRYPVAAENRDWRGYVVPCVGHLHSVVKRARDLANA